jgi:hypothetical protein
MSLLFFLLIFFIDVGLDYSCRWPKAVYEGKYARAVLVSSFLLLESALVHRLLIRLCAFAKTSKKQYLTS